MNTPSTTPSLDQLQRWMQAVITHPDGVAAGCGCAEACEQIEVTAPELERVLTRSQSLPAADRLAVYSHAYTARLIECLREEFPALVYTLEPELFDEFAIGYLERYPSRSYTLHHLGANFPQYLTETCPADEDPRWVALLLDLARLERLYSDVFDGPGSEGQTLMSVEHLARVAPEQLASARLVPAPDLRLIELRSPVHEYIRAVRRKQDPAPPEPAETFLAVHRRDYTVRRHALSRSQFVLLSALVSGETVGDVIGTWEESLAADASDLASSLQDWFRDWAAEGLFQRIDLPVA